MKYPLVILALIAILAAFPARSAWTQGNIGRQCMEDCLAPAIESGEADTIEAAIEDCLNQCSSKTQNTANLGDDTCSDGLGDCLSVCSTEHSQCEDREDDPRKCQLQYEDCREKCYRKHCSEYSY